VSEIISGTCQLNVRQLTKESIIEKTYSFENLPNPSLEKGGKEGYGMIDIRSPREVLDEEDL